MNYEFTICKRLPIFETEEIYVQHLNICDGIDTEAAKRIVYCTYKRHSKHVCGQIIGIIILIGYPVRKLSTLHEQLRGTNLISRVPKNLPLQRNYCIAEEDPETNFVFRVL